MRVDFLLRTLVGALVTTGATTDADDAQLNTTCGAPATDASVWYSLQGSGKGVVADVSSSDYSAGVRKPE